MMMESMLFIFSNFGMDNFCVFCALVLISMNLQEAGGQKIDKVMFIFNVDIIF